MNDQAYERSINLVRQRQAFEVVSSVKQHGVHSGDWLDVGCGVGNLLLEAKQAGFRILGLEPDPKAVSRARSLIGDEFIYQGLLSKDVVPDDSADIISTMDVLEHIPTNSLSNFAHMLHRKLRPNGLWCIKVPSTDGLYFQIAHMMLQLLGAPMYNGIKRLWQSEYKFPHTVYFNQHSLRRYLENHHFKVVDYKYLEEIPDSTVLDRMLVDPTISRHQAFLFAPGFYLINFIERKRGKSDALLMLARR